MTRAVKALLIGLVAAGLAQPVHATGGFLCRTAGTRPIEIAVGIGHVPGAPVIAVRMRAGGQAVPVTAAQWWFDGNDLRLHLIDRGALRSAAVIRARRNGHNFDGSVTRAGKRRWIRCRED